MKKLTHYIVSVVITLIIFTNQLTGQEQDEKINKDLFFSLNCRMTTIDASPALLAGLDIGFIFDKRLILGGTITSSTNPLVLQGYEESYNWMVNAGMTMGYIFEPGKKIHPVLKLNACYGFLFIDNMYSPLYEINPSVLFEINIRERLIFDFGIGYRANNPLDLYAYKYAYLSGPELVINVKWLLGR